MYEDAPARGQRGVDKLARNGKVGYEISAFIILDLHDEVSFRVRAHAHVLLEYTEHMRYAVLLAQYTRLRLPHATRI